MDNYTGMTNSETLGRSAENTSQCCEAVAVGSNGSNTSQCCEAAAVGTNDTV